MADPTDDTLSPLDEIPGAIPCIVCGVRIDEPESDGWQWDDHRLGWVCRQCLDNDPDQQLGAE
jgi:hypothetical protein